MIAAALLHLLSLMRTPAPFVDEGWNANRAWAFLATGRPFGTMDSGVFDRFDGYWTYFPWLGTWIHAQAIRFLGPELLSLRLVSLLFGLVLLGTVYHLGNRLYGQRVGLVAAGLLAVSPAFLSASHMARHDVIVAAFGFGAIALQLSDSSSSLPGKSLLSGLIAALTLDIHPIGIVYLAAIGGLYLLDHGRSVLRARRFSAYCLGAAVGLVWFTAIHLLPYPQTYLALGNIGFGGDRAPPFATPDPAVWLQSATDMGRLLGLSSDLLALLIPVALVVMLAKGTKSDRWLLALFALLLLAFVAVVRYKGILYGVMVAPISCLLIAVSIDRLVEWWTGAHRIKSLKAKITSDLALVLMVSIALTSLVRSLESIRDDPMPDYLSTTALMERLIPADDSVMGPQSYWFGLTDRQYLSWEQLLYYQRYAPGSRLEDAFRALHPQFLIIDKQMANFITGDRQRLAEPFRYLHLSSEELEAFLNRRGHLLASVETKSLGRVRIYRIDSN